MEALQTFNSFKVKSAVRGGYSVHFTEDLKTILAAKAAVPTSLFVIDEKLKLLFSDELKSIIEGGRCIFINSDESHKTIDYSQEVIRMMIGLNVRKNDSIVAIGGGITQDIVAFISSILYRGVNWEFFPSTLLAQCDSCIGSKSSINFDQFKNLVGTFCPPSDIYIYPGFLETLTTSEIRSGIGEMLHYFFTEDSKLASQIGERFDELLENRSLLPYFINNSLRIKKKIIEIDEFDTSIRHIFNYGHTFGHAIEAITNYAIPHGQAICLGMNIANYISLKRGMINDEQFEEMYTILVKNIPAFRITGDNIESYCQALARDKKNQGNQLGCILTYGQGKVEKVFLEMDDHFRKTLLDYFLKFSI